MRNSCGCGVRDSRDRKHSASSGSVARPRRSTGRRWPRDALHAAGGTGRCPDRGRGRRVGGAGYRRRAPTAGDQRQSGAHHARGSGSRVCGGAPGRAPRRPGWRATWSGPGRSLAWAWGAPSTSSRAGPGGLPAGCASTGWNGFTGSPGNPGAGAACWRCHASWCGCCCSAGRSGRTKEVRDGAVTLLTVIAAWLRRVTSAVVLRWLLFVAVFSLAAVPPLDPDLWWHLANGRLILTTGSIPHVDVYSFSAAGQPWVMHEWLADLGMYLLYQRGGLPLMVAIFAGIVTASAVCLYLLLRQTGLAASAAT